VGISPRTHRFHPEDGQLRYMNWQYTWWNGLYSIVLTKASLIHRDYLVSSSTPSSSFLFDQQTPPSLLSFIEKNRNCEDLAIAYLTTKQVRKEQTSFPV
jgi:hypothetical protein